MMVRLIGRLLSVPWLLVILISGCGSGRPEGDIPPPRPATQKEMEESTRLVDEGLRKATASGGLTSANKPR
jgi:hypothetical protein